MAQFDVYLNPIAAARGAYPLVVALQSDIALNARDQIVAPLVPRPLLPKIAGRLMPVVELSAGSYVALVPALASVRSRDLSHPLNSLSAARGELLAAVDFLFFGV